MSQKVGGILIFVLTLFSAINLYSAEVVCDAQEKNYPNRAGTIFLDSENLFVSFEPFGSNQEIIFAERLVCGYELTSQMIQPKCIFLEESVGEVIRYKIECDHTYEGGHTTWLARGVFQHLNSRQWGNFDCRTSVGTKNSFKLSNCSKTKE